MGEEEKTAAENAPGKNIVETDRRTNVEHGKPLYDKQGAPFPLFSLSSVTRLSEGSDPWFCVPTSQ